MSYIHGGHVDGSVRAHFRVLHLHSNSATVFKDRFMNLSQRRSAKRLFIETYEQVFHLLETLAHVLDTEIPAPCFRNIFLQLLSSSYFVPQIFLDHSFNFF